MNEIKVEVMFTDGYRKRYTEAVAKAYQKKSRKTVVESAKEYSADRDPRSLRGDVLHAPANARTGQRRATHAGDKILHNG